MSTIQKGDRVRLSGVRHDAYRDLEGTVWRITKKRGGVPGPWAYVELDDGRLFDARLTQVTRIEEA